MASAAEEDQLLHNLGPAAAGLCQWLHASLGADSASNVKPAQIVVPPGPSFEPSSMARVDEDQSSPVRIESQGTQGTMESHVAKSKKPNLSLHGSQKNVLTELPHNVLEVAEHPMFEMFFGILILGNASLMALEVQYNGFQVAYDMNYLDYSPANETWPNAAGFFNVLGMFFGVLFTIELFIKLWALRLDFFKSAWNCFDSLIIAFWIAGQLNEGVTHGLPVKPMILRLARLARIMRIVRVLKFIQALDALNLLVSSIMASVTILCWSALILSMVMMAGAMVLNYTLTECMEDESVDVGVRWAIFDYFGTFTRSMLSMFEITLGNWIPITRLLVDNVSEWYMGGFICYKVTVSFAVVKVITGVFMHETFKVASSDDDLMIVNQARMVAKHRSKMHALMAECDESGDGNLDRDEFRSVMRDPRVKTWLSAMELNVSDPDALFNLLDNDPAAPGIITADELAGGVSRLKGTARSLDMAQLREEMKRVAEKIDFIVSTTSNAPRSQTESASASSALSSQEPQVLLSSIGRALAPVEYSLNELLHEIRGAVIGSGSVGPSSRTQQTDNKPPGLLSRRPPVANGLQACPRLDMGTTREISNDMVADR